jgi:hypothetical protein
MFLGDQPNPTRRPTPEGDAIIAQFGLKKWPVLGPVIVVIVLQGYLLWILNRTQNGIVLETNGVRKPFLFAEFLAGVSVYFYREILPWGAVGALSPLSQFPLFCLVWDSMERFSPLRPSPMPRSVSAS